MTHSFNVNIAKKYGINQAIIFQHLYFWIEKNRANEKHFYDGYYWTYNSAKAFTIIFSYMTERQINYSISKLIESGLVITGNYNQSPYDRTRWYAITNLGYSMLQNCKMEEPNLENGKTENGEPIPDIKTDIKTNINSLKKERKNSNVTEDKTSFNELIENFCIGNSALEEKLKSFVQMRFRIKKELTNSGLKELLNTLVEISDGNQKNMIEIVKKSLRNSWTDFYKLKENNQKTAHETSFNMDEYESYNLFEHFNSLRQNE